MSGSEPSSGISGPLAPQEQLNPSASDQSTLNFPSPPAETPVASRSIYDQPTVVGSQPFEPPSGPIVPIVSQAPVTMTLQPPATQGVGGSSRGGFRWALSFALFGLVLALTGGVVFFVTPGPSPAFASEQRHWMVNPVIGLPTVIVGLLLLVVPFVLPVALKLFGQKTGQAGINASPALVGAAPLAGAVPVASVPMEAAPPMSGSQPFQPPSGPLPQMPGSQPWPPLGPTGQS